MSAISHIARSPTLNESSNGGFTSSGVTASSTSTAPTPAPRKPSLFSTMKQMTSSGVLTNRPRVPAKKAPWRAPGNWQIPDIIKESWEKRTPPPPKEPPKLDSPTKPTLPKRPWIPVGKSPSILPLPPLILRVQKKPHAVFDAKLRKALPESKIVDSNPANTYAGLSKVGSGANGAVVRASKQGNKGQVAIKRCFIEDRDIPHHAYVLRELRIMGCLNHTNLIQLKEATLWGDYVWMAMELMTCSVFGLLVDTTHGLPETMAVRIAKECLEGIVYLHAKNYMHRDIKCENILLGRNGQVKLADFGLATPISKVNTARLGTAKWMAPEVVAELSYKENVDVWSMAITTIEMMDRVPPLYYLEETEEIYGEILHSDPPSFNFTVPSPAMLELITWMLDPDMHRRPNARAVLNRIKQWMAAGELQCAKQAELGAYVRQVFPHETPSPKH
ncbi:kinase-like domain-containing protein [Spinellus fusiger]|nr:kinase-like domain-containing protein [Spinellus fusiger]